MGKTYYLLNKFVKMIYITFVPYTKISDHVEAAIKSGKSVGIILIDNLDVKKLPKMDIMILDCSKTEKHSDELQHFLINTIDKNSNHYTTLAIDECQKVLPSSLKVSKGNPILDRLADSRNYGYRTILASQRPNAVSAQAVELCTYVIAFKIVGKNAIKAMKEALEFLGYYDYLETNQQLKKREFKEYELIG